MRPYIRTSFSDTLLGSTTVGEGGTGGSASGSAQCEGSAPLKRRTSLEGCRQIRHIGLALLLAAIPAYPMGWDPAPDLTPDLIAPGDPPECIPFVGIEGIPLIEGHSFVGQTVTIRADHVQLVEHDPNCQRYSSSLDTFHWNVSNPDGTPGTLDEEGTLHPRLELAESGTYTVELVACDFGCEFDEPGASTIGVGPATRTIEISTMSHLLPETVPALPAFRCDTTQTPPVCEVSRKQCSSDADCTPSPTFVPADDLDEACRPFSYKISNIESCVPSEGAIEVRIPGVNGAQWIARASRPGDMAITDWLGSGDYANVNRDTGVIEAVEGWARKTRIAKADSRFNHSSQDVNFNLVLDPIHRGFLMETDGHPAKDSMHNEWEEQNLPGAFRPSNGDRASQFGYWIHDCGHSPFRTEIHPPVGVASHRMRAIRLPDTPENIPGLDAPVGTGVYVPGILTEVWFNPFAGKMMQCDLTTLHQPAKIVDEEIFYCCGDQIFSENPGECPNNCDPFEDPNCFPGVDLPEVVFRDIYDSECIEDPSPVNRRFMFHIYLPRNPKAILEEAGVEDLPEIPLYAKVIDGQLNGNLVDIERVQEGEATYLRVTVDLRNHGNFSTWFRIAAAWVYPSPENWGLHEWRVRVPSIEVKYDGDSDSILNLFDNPGEWNLWVQVNNAAVETNRDAGNRPLHEWTKVVDEDVTDGTFDFHGRPWSTGNSALDRSLGPDLKLFPDLPNQNIHLHASGYDYDGSLKAQDGVSLINVVTPPFPTPVGNPFEVPNVCSEGNVFEDFIEGGCSRFDLRYEILDLGPAPPPTLSQAAQDLYDAYDLDTKGCDPVEPGCIPGVFVGDLPAQELAPTWHPLQEPPPEESRSIFETELFEPFEIEENLLLHVSHDRFYRMITYAQVLEPETVAKTLLSIRAALDEDIELLGNEALLNAQALRAALPKDLWEEYFGDIRPPKPAPGSSKRKMTGSAKIQRNDERIKVNLILHCNALRPPNKLAVEWGGRRFDLDLITRSGCEREPEHMRTHAGFGLGRLDGVPGAKASWVFVDGGEPANDDQMQLLIEDQTGATVLELIELIDGANVQAH